MRRSSCRLNSWQHTQSMHMISYQSGCNNHYGLECNLVDVDCPLTRPCLSNSLLSGVSLYHSLSCLFLSVDWHFHFNYSTCIIQSLLPSIFMWTNECNLLVNTSLLKSTPGLLLIHEVISHNSTAHPHHWFFSMMVMWNINIIQCVLMFTNSSSIWVQNFVLWWLWWLPLLTICTNRLMHSYQKIERLGLGSSFSL